MTPPSMHQLKSLHWLIDYLAVGNGFCSSVHCLVRQTNTSLVVPLPTIPQKNMHSSWVCVWCTAVAIDHYNFPADDQGSVSGGGWSIPNITTVETAWASGKNKTDTCKDLFPRVHSSSYFFGNHMIRWDMAKTPARLGWMGREGYQSTICAA